MANVLVAYGSSTGNTAIVAEMVASQLQAHGHTVNVQDVAKLTPHNLCDSYDAILFGCSTWGYDEIEFQADFDSFYEDFDEIGAEGKKTAVFGCGEVTYPYFCGAVDEIEERLESLKATLMTSGLKVDGNPQDMAKDIHSWAGDILKAL